MRVFLDRNVKFNDCSCHGGGEGIKTYRAGTPCWVVTRDKVKDPQEKKALLGVVERMLKAGKKPVVVRLGGKLRVLNRNDVVTEEVIKKRRV